MKLFQNLINRPILVNHSENALLRPYEKEVN